MSLYKVKTVLALFETKILIPRKSFQKLTQTYRKENIILSQDIKPMLLTTFQPQYLEQPQYMRQPETSFLKTVKRP